jgi:carotenoid cleavage dioxygenase-like enzyme|tara:strand:- start:5938 stop:6198 length:261 start_codon:yes stop_codon:yes gene_type:complete
MNDDGVISHLSLTCEGKNHVTDCDSFDGITTVELGSPQRAGRQLAMLVKRIEIDHCYAFHVLNSYEDGYNVIVDIVKHNYVFSSLM